MIVERPPADKTAPNAIIDSVLTTRASQIERGRNAIEETALDKLKKTAVLLQDQYLPTGVLYRVYDKGEPSIGLAIDFSLNASASGKALKISTQTILEIPK